MVIGAINEKVVSFFAASDVEPESWKEEREDIYDRIDTVYPPFDHQRKNANEAYRNLTDAGYHALFMDMGTGKTKTTLDIFSAMYDEYIDGIVIVAPKAILSVWADEVPKHSKLPFSIYIWDGKTTKKSQLAFEMTNAYDGPAMFVVNIESFQTLPIVMRDRLRSFMQKRKCLMAIDESSYAKSIEAHRTKNVILAGKLARCRMILTGTEIVNSTLDLYSQFEFLSPGFFGFKSFWQFRNRYAILVDAYGSGGRTFKKVAGFQRTNELMDRITPFVSRAIKSECLDLPEKIYAPIRVDLSDKQKEAYASLKKHLAAMINDEVLTVPNKIALFTKFRQIVGGAVNIEGESYVVDDSPPKLQALLADLVDTEEQVIVWCSFTHEIEAISKALSEIGSVVTFYGDIPQDMRDENMRAFQRGDARFFVANPQAAGFGLNLQNCHLQYFYSRNLSPAVNWQAEDRSHRPGQRSPCVYKALIARGTVDERIEQLLATKTDVRESFRDMTISDLVMLV